MILSGIRWLAVSLLGCATLFALVACAPDLPGALSAQEEDEAAIAGERGLPVSAAAPSFTPLHLTGPDSGKKACPLCKYGLGPQFQLWVEEDNLPSALAVAKELDAEAKKAPRSAAHASEGFVPYIVLSPTSAGSIGSKTRQLLASARFERLFVVQVPRWDDRATSGLCGHSMKDRPGVRGYLIINRRVFRRWDKPSAGVWPEIKSALAQGRQHVTTYDLSDSQIAPTWEPGHRLTVRFRVVGRDGKPLSGQKVKASQTNSEGLYNPRGWGRRAPTLATTAWTNPQGWITFDTLMPGPYPSEPEPAHIHFSTVVSGRARFRTLWFEGDPRLTSEKRTWAGKDEETLIVPIDKRGTKWTVEHTFIVSKA